MYDLVESMIVDVGSIDLSAWRPLRISALMQLALIESQQPSRSLLHKCRKTFCQALCRAGKWLAIRSPRSRRHESQSEAVIVPSDLYYQIGTLLSAVLPAFYDT